MSMLRRYRRNAPANDFQGQVPLSVIIPVRNEESNITVLYARIAEVLSAQYDSFEIVIVDDGSTDNSYAILEEIARSDKRVKVVKFSRNFGQTAALMAGVDLSSGKIIVTMDGDSQNDPSDIPLLISKLSEGFDLVCGWRKDRKDPLILRRLLSVAANKILYSLFKVPIHDYGCALKAFKARSIHSVKLYGEMHRFIPAIIAQEGGRVVEIEVKHHSRVSGKSKYGVRRIFKVSADMLLLKFMFNYSTCPIHFFGYFGFLSIGLGMLVGIFTLHQRYIAGLPGVNLLPLILLTMLLIIIGVQTFLIGILAEIGMRNYYETQDEQIYFIDKILNDQ